MGEHPVIYAGAGSHASYFQPGEYLAELELPFLSPLVRLVDRLNAIGRRLIRETRGPHHPDANSASSFNVFRIPFVDYARGDGRSIGPTGSRPWAEAVLLDEQPKLGDGIPRAVGPVCPRPDRGRERAGRPGL